MGFGFTCALPRESGYLDVFWTINEPILYMISSISTVIVTDLCVRFGDVCGAGWDGLDTGLVWRYDGGSGVGGGEWWMGSTYKQIIKKGIMLAAAGGQGVFMPILCLCCVTYREM